MNDEYQEMAKNVRRQAENFKKELDDEFKKRSELEQSNKQMSK